MNAEMIVQLLILAVSKAEALSSLYGKMKAEGREEASEEEKAALRAMDDESRRKLQEWIDSK